MIVYLKKSKMCLTTHEHGNSGCTTHVVMATNVTVYSDDLLLSFSIGNMNARKKGREKGTDSYMYL